MKQKTIIIYIFLSLILSCSHQELSKNEKRSQIFYNFGTRSLMTKDYTKALKNLLKAHELNPKDSNILNNLGMAYFFKGKNNLAIQFISESLKINPKNSDARNNLASIYLQDNQEKLALSEYQKVLKDLTYDRIFQTQYNIGLLYEKNKKDKLAKKFFLESIRNNDQFCPAHFKLGRIYLNEENFNNALKHFKKSVYGTCNNKAAPHFYQAVTLKKMGKLPQAKMKLLNFVSNFKDSDFQEKASHQLLELEEIKIPIELKLKQNLLFGRNVKKSSDKTNQKEQSSSF